MELIDYINRGGLLVYILIGLNIIGFSIMFFKSIVLFNAKKDLAKKAQSLSTIEDSSKLQNSVSLEIKNLESGLSTVKNIASISPLLGLLGTVVGVLDAFDAISKHGLGDPAIFSSGISIALITTVAGLVVAIPHYIGYNYFIGTLDSLELKLMDKVHSYK